MISNLAQFVNASGRFRADAPTEPINLLFTRAPAPTKAELTGIEHLIKCRYPMTSEDRLNVVDFISKHPNCRLAEIRKGLPRTTDINTILYDLCVRHAVLTRTGVRAEYRYRVAK